MPLGAHRITTHPFEGRVRVRLDGAMLADSERAVALEEGRLPVRYYLPQEDVLAKLAPSEQHTFCPFKGTASYYSIELPDGTLLEDLVWYYPEPRSPAADVAGMLCFPDDRVSIEAEAQKVA